ncbi:type II toxin-antitoxin system VapC family toxin [Desertivirga xinjiangensis]|uniref:type II toxin-antitoxin system VapC family toxin n=1 Tax=Desertivirga xinjiangensis TaxID=539206 RepID=UPI00210CBA20|nr:type II toxin-antitoxin system VapC family toxin [Pedobacter xinjiangensis]
MTGNDFLIDTSIIVDIFGGNTEFADKLSDVNSLYISSIVLGELYVGINRVSNKTKHLKKLQSFLDLCTVLPVDDKTADYFGQIMASLFKKGKPIPTNDVWIAATAKQYALTLISKDAHFALVDDLLLYSW